MNKIITSISIICIFAFASCNLNSKQNVQEIQDLVASSEKFISQCDNNIQSAIDSKNFDYIKTVTKNATDSIDNRLEQLRSLSVSASHQELQDAAILYLEALQNIINTEEIYISLSDSVSETDAKNLDGKFQKAVESAKQEYAQYIAILQELIN